MYTFSTRYLLQLSKSRIPRAGACNIILLRHLGLGQGQYCRTSAYGGESISGNEHRREFHDEHGRGGVGFKAGAKCVQVGGKRSDGGREVEWQEGQEQEYLKKLLMGAVSMDLGTKNDKSKASGSLKFADENGSSRYCKSPCRVCEEGMRGKDAAATAAAAAAAAVLNGKEKVNADYDHADLRNRGGGMEKEVVVGGVDRMEIEQEGEREDDLKAYSGATETGRNNQKYRDRIANETSENAKFIAPTLQASPKILEQGRFKCGMADYLKVANHEPMSDKKNIEMGKVEKKSTLVGLKPANDMEQLICDLGMNFQQMAAIREAFKNSAKSRDLLMSSLGTAVESIKGGIHKIMMASDTADHKLNRVLAEKMSITEAVDNLAGEITSKLRDIDLTGELVEQAMRDTEWKVMRLRDEVSNCLGEMASLKKEVNRVGDTMTEVAGKVLGRVETSIIDGPDTIVEKLGLEIMSLRDKVGEVSSGLHKEISNLAANFESSKTDMVIWQQSVDRKYDMVMEITEKISNLLNDLNLPVIQSTANQNIYNAEQPGGKRKAVIKTLIDLLLVKLSLWLVVFIILVVFINTGGNKSASGLKTQTTPSIQSIFALPQDKSENQPKKSWWRLWSR